ncbi:hypothetical protein LR48_Vigan118s002600 [Vigna angularis]|uniref:Uncharacterized protein n=1 Tax=Phaseolus angularis TaxID=3914 RepID=A0A0L9T5G6_PHAAN|nr:hypothetical protein LR48_Vigan118s002600 [Vigna angularis]
MFHIQRAGERKHTTQLTGSASSNLEQPPRGREWCHGDGAYAETASRQSPAALEDPLCFHSLHDDMQATIHVEGISRVFIPATINKLFSYGKEKHPAVHTHHIKRKKIVQSCNG